MSSDLEKLKASLEANEDAAGTASFRSTPRSEIDTNTIVVGGFKGACSKEEVDGWLRHVLSKAGAEYPTDTYIKCKDMKDFNGVVFGKYNGPVARDKAIKMVKESAQTYEGQQVWAKSDMPLEIRTAQGVLFAAKHMLTSSEWGFDKKSLWVDTDNNILTCGNEKVMNTRVENQKLHIGYASGWQDFIAAGNEGWAKTIKEAEETISKKPTKGIGKGFGKGKKGE